MEESPTGDSIVVSSVYPGAAHDPSLARVLIPDDQNNLRWVDARQAIIYPNGEPTQLISPASTPLHPAFQSLAERIETIDLETNDLDPNFTIYDLQIGNWSWADEDINFGNALTLLGAQWLNEPVAPGDTAELLTIWRVVDPSKVGPIVPPAFETNVVLFTHVVDESGKIIAQRDSIEAPSWGWQSGDIILQIHPITLQENIKAGTYKTFVGIYDRASGERLPQLDSLGKIVDSNAGVVPLIVNEQ